MRGRCYGSFEQGCRGHLEFLEDVELNNIVIKDIVNTGKKSVRGQGNCKDAGFIGGDVRRFAITNVKGLKYEGGDAQALKGVTIEGLHSEYGESFKIWSGCEAGSPNCPFAGANIHFDETLNPPNATNLVDTGIFVPGLPEKLAADARKRRRLRKLRKLAVVV